MSAVRFAPANVPARRALPPDPRAFVAAAERATNDRDLAAIMVIYASDPVLETLTDGAHEIHQGRAAVESAWRGYLGAMRAREFALRKDLLSAADGILVNEWHGAFGAGAPARGIETWRFDADGRVEAHALYTYSRVRPSTSLRQRACLLLNDPRLAVAFLIERHRATRGAS